MQNPGLKRSVQSAIPHRRLETSDLALESADVSDSQPLNKAFGVGFVSMLLAL